MAIVREASNLPDGINPNPDVHIPTPGGNSALPSVFVVGDLLAANSISTLSRIAAPAVGQVLKSNGVGVAPSWSASPSLTSLALGGATIGTDLIGAQGSYAKARVASTGALIVQGASVNDLLTFGGTASGTISYASNTLGTHYQFVGDRSGSGGGADLRLGSTALIAFNVNPALNTGALDTGLSRISAGVIGVGTGAQGSVAGGLSANLLYVGSTGSAMRIGTSGNGTGVFSNASGATSFLLTAPGTATMQHGAADAASPVAQTIKFQDVVAGTSNTAGVNATIQAPAGTGTGAGGSLIFQVAPAGSSGTAKNAWATAWQINSAGHLLAGADNAYDIGASGATRPRNIYIAGQLYSAGVFNTSGALPLRHANGDDVRIQNNTGSNPRLGFYTSGTVNNGVIETTADGVFTISNGARTDFSLLRFGGTTSSFPAIKRSTTSLQARLADDSAFTTIQGKLTTDTAYTAGDPTTTGYLLVYDSTGTAYRVPALLN